MEFDLENPLTNPQDDNNGTIFHPLFDLEADHMVSQYYTQNLQNMDLHFSLRRGTVSLISQFSGRFDPLLSYLAVNYLDRFFSSQGMPQAKPWVVKLLAISCVSLAAKMMEKEFHISDIQCGEGLIFDSQTIERMELLILGALQWRMRSITPFAFLHIFISLFKLKDPPLRQALKARALEIIFISQNETKFLEFKPSIVAASALLSASNELFPMQLHCFRRAISLCSFLNKEILCRCCQVMQEILMEGYESVFIAAPTGDGGDHPGGAALNSDTPVNVLDRNWSSSSTTTTTGATSTTRTDFNSLGNPNPERDTKRQRRMGNDIFGSECKNSEFSDSTAKANGPWGE
ncbi:hypothetical protein Dimus_009616 [Dionaea muscipula]